MGNLGEADGYPAGVSNADPHFHDDVDAPCNICGHERDEHNGDGTCAVLECSCSAYEPIEDV